MPRKPPAKSPQPADAYVGGRIRLRRTLARISQAELAQQIGVTSQQVQKYERGSNRIGASRLLQICAALEIAPAWLFEGAPGAKPRPGAAARRIESAIAEFHADHFAPQVILTFPRLPTPVRRGMVALMTALAGESDEID